MMFCEKGLNVKFDCSDHGALINVALSREILWAVSVVFCEAYLGYKFVADGISN